MIPEKIPTTLPSCDFWNTASSSNVSPCLPQRRISCVFSLHMWIRIGVEKMYMVVIERQKLTALVSEHTLGLES
jgi:hypothetical protein